MFFPTMQQCLHFVDTFSWMYKVLYVQVWFRNPISSGVQNSSSEGRITGAKIIVTSTLLSILFFKHALLASVGEGSWTTSTFDVTQNGCYYIIISHPSANWHGPWNSAGGLYALLFNETLLDLNFQS